MVTKPGPARLPSIHLSTRKSSRWRRCPGRNSRHEAAAPWQTGSWPRRRSATWSRSRRRPVGEGAALMALFENLGAPHAAADLVEGGRVGGVRLAVLLRRAFGQLGLGSQSLFGKHRALPGTLVGFAVQNSVRRISATLPQAFRRAPPPRRRPRCELCRVCRRRESARRSPAPSVSQRRWPATRSRTR